MLFDSWWKKLPKVDRYHIAVVTNPTELEYSELLPIEIRYVLAVRPSRHETFRKLLEQNFGIGVRTVDKTPERILQAVERISRESQHNTIVPWLENILRSEELPVFSEEERKNAEAKGIHLYEEAHLILAHRYEFKKIVLVPLENQQLTHAEQKLVEEVNEDLFPHAIDVIVNRVTFDHAHTRTEVAQAIIKALVIVGPIAHFLEHVLSGIGKVFAATSDDLLSEAAELMALRGSGFTWRQLFKRFKLLIVVFCIATWAAFQVEPLIHADRLMFAGITFGLSAVALSLTTAIQSIQLYHQAYTKLLREGKIRLRHGRGLWRHALHQDFTNPARFGLFVGAASSPIIAGLVFFFFPSWTQNGWLLALLGSVESVVASLTVMAASHLNRFRFRRRVQKALASLIIGPR